MKICGNDLLMGDWRTWTSRLFSPRKSAQNGADPVDVLSLSSSPPLSFSKLYVSMYHCYVLANVAIKYP